MLNCFSQQQKRRQGEEHVRTDKHREGQKANNLSNTRQRADNEETQTTYFWEKQENSQRQIVVNRDMWSTETCGQLGFGDENDNVTTPRASSSITALCTQHGFRVLQACHIGFEEETSKTNRQPQLNLDNKSTHQSGRVLSCNGSAWFGMTPAY